MVHEEFLLTKIVSNFVSNIYWCKKLEISYLQFLTFRCKNSCNSKIICLCGEYHFNRLSTKKFIVYTFEIYCVGLKISLLKYWSESKTVAATYFIYFLMS